MLIKIIVSGVLKRVISCPAAAEGPCPHQVGLHRYVSLMALEELLPGVHHPGDLHVLLVLLYLPVADDLFLDRLNRILVLPDDRVLKVLFKHFHAFKVVDLPVVLFSIIITAAVQVIQREHPSGVDPRVREGFLDHGVMLFQILIALRL